MPPWGVAESEARRSGYAFKSEHSETNFWAAQSGYSRLPARSPYRRLPVPDARLSDLAHARS